MLNTTRLLRKNTRGPIGAFDVLRALPLGSLGLCIPCSQGTFGIGISLPKQLQRFHRNDPHEKAHLVPNLGTRAIRYFIVVEIRDHRNMVAFKTPTVAKKPPLLIVEQALLYQLSHQLNHLARLFSAGIAVAE
jgi:hypothetical protein